MASRGCREDATSIGSAPGAWWAGPGLPLPFSAETSLPLSYRYRYRRWVRVDGGRGVPWVGLAWASDGSPPLLSAILSAILYSNPTNYPSDTLSAISYIRSAIISYPINHPISCPISYPSISSYPPATLQPLYQLSEGNSFRIVEPSSYPTGYPTRQLS